ncbi:MAG: hypothetical protein JWM96_13 [Alphaproteobacteria bacterium]|nr:hypothetical protein [Alphaproteobacteria bacterium]
MTFAKARLYFGSLAALLWTSGDALTAMRQYLETHLETLVPKAGILDTVAGCLLLGSNAYMMARGHRHDAVIVRQGSATVALVLMIISSGVDSAALLSTVSLAGIAAGCAASALQAWRDRRQQKRHAQRRGFLGEYPQFLPMLPNIFFNAFYMLGGVVKHSALEIAVGALWTIGTVCFALSKQRIAAADNK